MNSVVEPAIPLIIHQIFKVIPIRKAFVDVESMLCYPTLEIPCHPNVKRSLILVGKNVYCSLKRHSIALVFRVKDSGSSPL